MKDPALRVLVTRPAQQQTKLCQLIEAQGWQAVPLPTVEIQPIYEPEPGEESQAFAQQRELFIETKQLILDLDRFDKVIAISQNAAYWGLHWCDQYWPQWPLGLEWFAIGPSSAVLLREAGLQVHQPDSEFSSEGLLKLSALQYLAGQKVLILRGSGGRELLKQSLIERGAEVSYAALYRRVCPNYEAKHLQALWIQHKINALIVTSQEGLQNLLSLTLSGDPSWRAQLLKTLLILPSQRVATFAQAQGFSQCRISQSVTDQAIIDCLASHISKDE